MNKFDTYPNPDLVVGADNKPPYNQPHKRRMGFRNLHRMQRYSFSLRSDRVMALFRDIDPRIGQRDDVRLLTQTQEFCAMVVVKGQRLLFEKYAPDFVPDQLHAMQSITKLTANLIIGQLVGEGKVHLHKKVSDYIPEIGSGYADASIQQVLHMDVQNDYSEDYNDPMSTTFENEVAVGWRLPEDGMPEPTAKEFLCSIKAKGNCLENLTPLALYKTANTDILGWISERVSGLSLRTWILRIVEATGIEDNWIMQTDREGFAMLGGGASLTARDLARFGQLLCRYGAGINGQQIGDAEFILKTLTNTGRQAKQLLEDIQYSNQTFTNGEWIGHAGYGGQFMLANLRTGISIAFFSVLENRNASFPEYQASFIRMLESVAAEF